MKFSGKMCLKIILKVTKNQGFSLSLENMLFEKPQWGWGGGGGKFTPRSCSSVKECATTSEKLLTTASERKNVKLLLKNYAHLRNILK